MTVITFGPLSHVKLLTTLATDNAQHKDTKIKDIAQINRRTIDHNQTSGHMQGFLCYETP